MPETGIVSYPDVAQVYASETRQSGGQIETGARVLAVRRDGDALALETTRGAWRARALVNCAGLHADRVARLCGLDPDLTVVPFRGEYYELRPDRCDLVRNLVYPTPDPQFPFLGVHFTRMIHGGVEAGPNAVLALKREGYRRRDISLRDLAEMAAFGGSWHMAARGPGATDSTRYWRSFSARAFVGAMQRLVPAVTRADVRRAGSGVRHRRSDGMELSWTTSGSSRATA